MNRKNLGFVLLVFLSAVLFLSFSNVNVVNAAQTGWVEVHSKPTGASVYLDNVSKGDTPIFGGLTINNVNIGNHEIRLHKNGYQTYSATITVNANQKTLVNVTLTPAFTYTCSDTDGGVSISYNVQGTATVTRSDGVVIASATDVCTTGEISANLTNLNEFSCYPYYATIIAESYYCVNGCSNGACSQTVPLNPTPPEPISLSPPSNNWVIWIIGIIVIALLIVWWSKRKKK